MKSNERPIDERTEGFVIVLSTFTVVDAEGPSFCSYHSFVSAFARVQFMLGIEAFCLASEV